MCPAISPPVAGLFAGIIDIDYRDYIVAYDERGVRTCKQRVVRVRVMGPVLVPVDCTPAVFWFYVELAIS